MRKRKRLEGGGRKLMSADLEEVLKAWFENERKQRRRVSRDAVKKKATQLYVSEEYDIENFV